MLRTARLSGAALVAAILLPGAPALGATHLVTPGETLSGIAAANGLSTSAVAAANGMSPTALAISGTRLTIPAPGSVATAPVAATSAPSTAAAPTGGGLRVRWGDSLSAIAARNGVSLARLAAVNGLDPNRPLLAGTTLRLPAAGGAGTSAAPAATTAAAPAPIGAYKVRPGDTLSGLAARSRVPMSQMAFMNGLDPSKPLLAGTVIKLPTGSPGTSAAPAGPVVGARAGAHHRASRAAGRVARPPHRVADRLDRRPARRARIARDGDRVAGERLQQRQALRRERARRHADPAGHLAMGAGQPGPDASRPVVGRGQRARRVALPRRPHAPDERRSRDGGGRLLPGPLLRAADRHAARHAALRGQRDGIARPLRRVAEGMALPVVAESDTLDGRSAGAAGVWRGTSGATAGAR